MTITTRSIGANHATTQVLADGRRLGSVTPVAANGDAVTYRWNDYRRRTTGLMTASIHAVIAHLVAVATT